MTELNTHTYPIKLPATLSADTAAQLEGSLATYLGYEEVIALESTEAAFSLALSILEEKSGILCSPSAPITFFRALRQHDLQAEFCDLRLDGTLETRFFSKTKTPQSGALLLSHNHGLLSDTAETHLFTQESGLTFIEDATQAFGKREKSGAALAVFSLDALLPASIAGGAIIATDDFAMGASLRQRAQGGFQQKKFWNYDLVSTKPDLRLRPLTAQLALEALREIEERAQRVKEIQNIYLDRLSSNRLVERPDAANLLPHNLFPVALIPALFCPKEDIYAALLEAGIPVKVGNKPIYKTTAFRDEALSLFGAEEVYKAQLLLPSHHLMSLEEAASIIDVFENVLADYSYRGCSF